MREGGRIIQEEMRREKEIRRRGGDMKLNSAKRVG